jgi:hypothetical protein
MSKSKLKLIIEMKKLLLIIFLFAFLEGKTQTIHRVTTGMNLQTEITNAPSGDIYYVDGGVLNTNLDIDKKVTIFGTGYFLSNNQASPGVSQVSHIRLKPGSDGSFISGLQCISINISANNIIIQRNYLTEPLRLGYTGLGGGGDWSGTANNCILIQNYASRLEIINQNAPNATATNFVVKGNIFYTYGFHLEGNLSGEISNNTFNADITNEETFHSLLSSVGGNFQCKIMPIVFKNNILPKILQQYCQINSYPTTIFNNNVFNQNFTNLPSSNIINANADALFMGYPTNPNNALTPDARCQLATNSIAKGAGEGGTDAGAFGGDTPYVLSGIPNIPNIYQLTVPMQVPQGSTLNVQIKAKTNN